MTDQDQAAYLAALAAATADNAARLDNLEGLGLEAQLGVGTSERTGIDLSMPTINQGVGPLEPVALVQDGAITDAMFATTIDPVLLRTTATLTNADAIANPNRVALNTDNTKLYRSDGATWTKAVDGGDIIAASIIAGKIAAGAISATELAALSVTASKLDIRDAAGVEVLSSAGFAGSWDDYIRSGVYNDAFGSGTPGALGSGGAISFWTLGRVGNAASSAVTLETDAGAGSGNHVKIELKATSGAASDNVYIEQLVPVTNDFPRASARYFYARALLQAQSASDTNLRRRIELQGIAIDGSTLVGSAVSQEITLGTAGFPKNLASYANLQLGATVAFVRVRVGLKRNTAATSATAVVYLYNVATQQAVDRIVLVDAISGGTTSDPMAIYGGGTSGQGIVVSASGGEDLIVDEDGITIHLPNTATLVSNVTGRTDFSGHVWAQDGIVTLQNAGAVSDAAFLVAVPLNGSMAHDTTNHRIYYKRGGAWHYAAETAGFQIPANETRCPVCLDPLLPDDDLIGKGDRVMADGALHALYIHLRCAGKPLDREVADAYWAADEASGR